MPFWNRVPSFGVPGRHLSAFQDPGGTSCHSGTEYLGHWISEKGIAPLQDYANTLERWPEPKTVKDVRVLLSKVALQKGAV